MKNGKKDITKTYRPVEPEVSVIIPAYNNEASVSEAVFSVCSGDYSDFEIILVDDGSEDRTHKVCEELQNGDERIRLITLPHKGVSAARNAGLDDAQGEYVAFIDADDFVTPDYLKKLTDAIKNDGEELDYALGAFCLEYRNCHNTDNIQDAKSTRSFFDSSIVRKGKEARLLLSDRCLKPLESTGCRVSTACMSLFRKSVLDECGLRFREDVVYGEDTLFVYSVAHHINGFSYINEPLYTYIRTLNSSTEKCYRGDFVKIHEDLFTALDEVADSYGETDRDCVKTYKLRQIVNIVYDSALQGEWNSSRDILKKSKKMIEDTLKDEKLSRYIHSKKEIAILWLTHKGFFRTLWILYKCKKRLRKTI